MSIYDYGNFNDGCQDVEFVAHAKKYTKQEAIELCIAENDWKFDEKYCDGDLLRVPTIEDVKENTARYYPHAPESCDFDGEGGCYSYCKVGERGSFPVWVRVTYTMPASLLFTLISSLNDLMERFRCAMARSVLRAISFPLLVKVTFMDLPPFFVTILDSAKRAKAVSWVLYQRWEARFLARETESSRCFESPKMTMVSKAMARFLNTEP